MVDGLNHVNCDCHGKRTPTSGFYQLHIIGPLSLVIGMAFKRTTPPTTPSLLANSNLYDLIDRIEIDMM